MRRIAVIIAAAIQAACRRVCTPTGERWAVVLLLLTQAGLLGYSATRHSPTYLEPAFLAAGISHWEFGRFELYRVNPPLVRMVAALPVLAVGCKTDWSRYYDGPGSRSEFPVGEDFIKANGPASIPLFFYARWACIPFNLIGSYFAYRWAKELYGAGAGIVTLTLYVFEPNLLAHGELITTDGPCTALGVLAGYTFWKWLKHPVWSRAFIAGATLGLAELSKMTWLFLFLLWPSLWLLWRNWKPRATTCAGESQPRNSTGNCIKDTSTSNRPPAIQMATILLVSIYAINLAYAFDGSGTRLAEFSFVSKLFAGLQTEHPEGNRYSHTLLGRVPMPLPKQYILGLDSQKKDFEHSRSLSYLRGQWKQGGWWYYYVYGLSVKLTCGTLGLLLVVVIFRLFGRPTSFATFQDEVVLLAPGVTVLVLVSMQTEFNCHLRYAFPTIGFGLIFLGQAWKHPGHRSCHAARPASMSALPLAAIARVGFMNATCLGLVGSTVVSTASVYPHHLAFFNEFAGGPRNGWRHILGSSFDWGQDLLYCWRNPDLAAGHMEFACYTSYEPPILVRGTSSRPLTSKQPSADARTQQPRFVVVSANIVNGMVPPRPTSGIPVFGSDAYRELLAETSRSLSAICLTPTVTVVLASVRARENDSLVACED